ncbi:unnamed protein product, partial [Protopolystoma xenopodis]
AIDSHLRLTGLLNSETLATRETNHLSGSHKSRHAHVPLLAANRHQPSRIRSLSAGGCGFSFTSDELVASPIQRQFVDSDSYSIENSVGRGESNQMPIPLDESGSFHHPIGTSPMYGRRLSYITTELPNETSRSVGAGLPQTRLRYKSPSNGYSKGWPDAGDTYLIDASANGLSASMGIWASHNKHTIYHRQASYYKFASDPGLPCLIYTAAVQAVMICLTRFGAHLE